MGNDAEENIEKLLRWGYEEIEANEALMRDALRISQLRWQESLSGEDNHKRPVLKKKVTVKRHFLRR